jgi:hypothetical protein
VNWALNVVPLLRPALAPLYMKITGKERPNAQICMNNAVCRGLTWFADRFASSSGVLMLENTTWSAAEADLVIHSDACLNGLAFFSDSDNLGFYASTPPDFTGATIFFLEAFTVLLAIHWAQPRYRRRKILVYCDNENTVAIFNTLKASGVYNDILRLYVDMVFESGSSVRVEWIPTYQNKNADLLSRQLPPPGLAGKPPPIISQLALPSEFVGALKL